MFIKHLEDEDLPKLIVELTSEANQKPEEEKEDESDQDGEKMIVPSALSKLWTKLKLDDQMRIW